LLIGSGVQPALHEIPVSDQGGIFPTFGTRFAEEPSVRPGGAMEGMMKRREFLKSATALAAAGVSAPAIWSPAKAQSRKETLLTISENGPNNLDVQGVGTNRPGYGRRGIATTA
jgi:hypothetical protein